MIGDCANCKSHICAGRGISCKKINQDEVLDLYTDEEKKIMKAAAFVEATYYSELTRLEETVEFAKQMGYKKLGLAFCIGLNKEAYLINKFLAREFEVVSICCKNCAIAKDKLGLKKINPQSATESMCNPKYQAEFLNQAGCDLFISCGLCVGHDAIFNKNCNGPVTTLVAKDRVLAHNPLGVVYSRYWRKKLKLMEENEMTDFNVILNVGKALGMGDLLDGWKTPQEVFEKMKKCSKGMPCDITGVDYNALVDSKGIQWPFKEGDTLTENERRLFEDGQFYTPSKKAQFMFEAVTDNPLQLTEEFPYVFNTGRGTVGQWHTQTRTREIAFVNDAVSHVAYVHINEELAKDLGIKHQEMIEITSINGVTRRFMAMVSDTVAYNELFAPIHYIEINALTPSVYDPYSKEPSYKSTPVQINKVKGA